jgi:hypothetical protein
MLGEWVARPDGYWALRIPDPDYGFRRGVEAATDRKYETWEQSSIRAALLPPEEGKW